MGNNKTFDAVIIGAGLTGLTTATYLVKAGLNVLVLEKKSRIGGQIQTYNENGFVYESGPNTGSISNYEVIELFDLLKDKAQLIRASKSANKRLIWKKNNFHALPSGFISAVKTPLFSWYDKFRILAEPFRKKGDNPNESVGELACRRLGKSFFDYAVDPFISGIYAGDPMKLVTKYALPKLYRLEQENGSFIKGALKKAFKKKTFEEKATTKEVFSVKGGLSNLVYAMSDYIGDYNIVKNVADLSIKQSNNNIWHLQYTDNISKEITNIYTNNVITTTGAYEIPNYMTFLSENDINCIASLKYAPVVQVSVAIKKLDGDLFNSFGGLIPSKENKKVLGILFLSKCFDQDKRASAEYDLLSVFMGGVKKPEYINMSDEEISQILSDSICDMMKCKKDDFQIIQIFRHEKAVPQYEENCNNIFKCIDKLEKQYPGLYIKGGIIGGIGMSDRIKQGVNTAKNIIKTLKN